MVLQNIKSLQISFTGIYDRFGWANDTPVCKSLSDFWLRLKPERRQLFELYGAF